MTKKRTDRLSGGQCSTTNSHKGPVLPWPLPAGGLDLVVARWPYRPQANGKHGDWVYAVHIGMPWPDLLSMRGIRFREDYRTHRRSRLQAVYLSRELPVNAELKCPPALARAFDSFVQQLQERARRDQKLYEETLARMARAASMRLLAMLVLAQD
jgi:hypothetical protein